MAVMWNIGCIIRKKAQTYPNKTAIVFEDTPVTFKELDEGSNRCAHLMLNAGVKRGDRVAALLENSTEFFEIYFAAAKIGAIFVPLNTRLVGPEFVYQLNDSGARMMFLHDSFAATIDGIRSELTIADDDYILLHDSADRPEWGRDYLELMNGQSKEEPVLDEPVSITEPLAIIYTSGTTGNPKGAVVSHEQTFYKSNQVAMYFDSRMEDVVVAQMPMFHSGGLFVVATPTLNTGATLILRRNFDPEVFAKDIEKYKGTVVFGLTTMWRMILSSKMLDHIDVSSVRRVMGGGERTPQTLMDGLAEKGLYMQQGFGQTENSFMMLMPQEDIQRKPGSIGKPGSFTDVWIADEEGNRLGPNETGEIVASGPTVMSGYWGLPEKTAETIVDGVLHTGDLGYIDEDGFFYIVDRAKDMYRSGGENVYPAQVEKILLGHPAIINVAIIGVVDENWGETGKAFLVLEPNETITLEEIHAFLENKVSRYKFPLHIGVLDELPMTATMKVRKAELKKLEDTDL